jgi:hypothetical protein
MDDAMVNPRSEMERIPSARMESSARRAPSPVRRPYVARFPPATVAIRNGLRFKSSDSVPNRRVQLGHSPFRTSPLLDRSERVLAWPTCQSSEGL